MMYNKISGFSDEISRDVDIQFQVLNKLGIKYTEPRGIGSKNISELTDEEIMLLKGKLEEYGIQISSIGSPIGKVKLTDSFEEHFEKFKRVVQIAKELNTSYIRIFSFYHEGGDVWTAKERDEVLLRLRKMIAYAEEQGIILLHENEKDIYGDTADRCIDLMKELYGPHFRAVFDPANFVQSKQDTKYAYENLKEYIEYIHIKDALYEDGMVVPAGEGDGNVEYILRAILAAGYDGYLSVEPHLGRFAGLESMELNDRMKGLPPGGEGTFTMAYEALCKILEEI